MDKVSKTPRTDAIKGYQERCEMLHGDKIVTHAMCFARASEEADELHSLCEKLEEELAAAIAQRDKLVAAFAHLRSFVRGDLQEYDAVEVASIINVAIKECGK